MIKPIEHIINIDLAKKINTNQSINIKENDNNSHKFVINIFDNSVHYDLTGSTSRVYFLKKDGTEVFLDCTLDNALTGKISCLLTTQALTCPGLVATEITVYGSAGEILTSVTFNFFVSNVIRNDAAIESTSEFTALTNALVQVNNWNAQFQTKYDNLESEYSTELNNLMTSQADNTKKIPLPSFKTNINKFGIKRNPFLTFRQALLKTNNVIFTFWGDSISTNGDKLNVNSTTPNGSDYAPNGITNSENYTNIITNEIAKSFPNNKFDFYNKAIGGTTMKDWNTQQTIKGVTKTWLDHVKDTNCDVLFIGFGMNHNLYASSSTYASDFKKVYDYIYANFTKIPDIVLVTSPTSVYILGNTTWSDDINQESRRNTGKSVRYFSSQYADYILDVSRFSDIARFGKDLENIYFEEKTTFTTAGVTALKNINDKLTINEKCRDFTIKFTLSASNVTDGECILITFNDDTDGITSLNNQLQIFPNKSGYASISSYGRICDNTNFPTTYNTANYTHTSALSAGYFRIEKKGNILKVFLGDIPEAMVIYDTKLDINNILGSISFKKQGGSTSTINILALQYFEAKYHDYKTIITEEEMWGKYVDGDYTTKAITGGNGANHPSSKGVAKVYGIPIYEMIKDITVLEKQKSDVTLELERQDLALNVSSVEIPGYCFDNITGVIFMQGYVTNSAGTIKLKQNKKVTSLDKKALLSDTEFGIYYTGGLYQIIFKNTMGATGYSTPFKFNTYQFI